MGTKVTVKEAEQIIQDSKVAEAAAWVAYREAKAALPPFDAGLKPCPKCGREMKKQRYTKGYEPREYVAPTGGFIFNIGLLYDDPITKSGTDKPEAPAWNWVLETLSWCCKCDYAFNTKPKDAK